jgi:hypothetical protein
MATSQSRGILTSWKRFETAPSIARTKEILTIGIVSRQITDVTSDKAAGAAHDGAQDFAGVAQAVQIERCFLERSSSFRVCDGPRSSPAQGCCHGARNSASSMPIASSSFGRPLRGIPNMWNPT